MSDVVISPQWLSASHIETSQLGIWGLWLDGEASPDSPFLVELLNPATGRVRLTKRMLEVVIESARNQNVRLSRGGQAEVQVSYFGSDGSLLIKLDRAAPVNRRLDQGFAWWRMVLVQYSEAEAIDLDVHGEMLSEFGSGEGLIAGESGFVPVWNIQLDPFSPGIPPDRVISVLEWWMQKMEMISNHRKPLIEDSANQLSIELTLDASSALPEEVRDDLEISWEPEWLPNRVVP